jgi:hypothetical protein
MEIIALWDIALCSLVEVDRRFGGGYCLHHQGGVPETSAYSETKRRYIAEGCRLHTGRRENLKSHA